MGSWTCSYDKSGLGSSCVSRVNLYLEQEKRQAHGHSLHVGGRVATGTRVVAPNYVSMMDLHITQKCMRPSCVSKVDLETGKRRSPQLHSEGWCFK